MKNVFIALVGLIISTALQAQSNQEVAIRQVLQEAYADGVFNQGNLAAVEKGFAASFTMFSLTADDSLKTISKSDWLERVKRNQEMGYYPVPEEKAVRLEFLNIDVEGKCAMVKLNFYQGQKLGYVDFIGLYQFSDGWKMVSKSFRTL